MVVEFLVLFMGRCTADDRLEICLFQDGLHLVDSLESNSALRGLPSLGGGRKDTSISSKSIRLEFLVFRAVELWAGLGAAVGRGGHGFRRYKVMRFSRCFSNFLQREELALLLKCEV